MDAASRFDTSQRLSRLIEQTGGILRLDPAFVARDWLPPGRRLGLAPEAYDLGERGFICERWLASTTHADNIVGPDDEGISYIRGDAGETINLADAVAAAPALLMGEDYAASHEGLGRLAKIFDFAARIPYHIHPPAEHAALVGRRLKDEAYYFPPGIDMGAHPETFFGVHPFIARGPREAMLLPYLEQWNDDAILQCAFAYAQIPGKRIRLAPGARFTSIERGLYNLLAWNGTGTVAGHAVAGRRPGEDELLVIHRTATRPHEIVNTGQDELLLVKFFGPDINPDAPPAGS